MTRTEGWYCQKKTNVSWGPLWLVEACVWHNRLKRGAWSVGYDQLTYSINSAAQPRFIVSDHSISKANRILRVLRPALLTWVRINKGFFRRAASQSVQYWYVPWFFGVDLFFSAGATITLLHKTEQWHKKNKTWTQKPSENFSQIHSTSKYGRVLWSVLTSFPQNSEITVKIPTFALS